MTHGYDMPLPTPRPTLGLFQLQGLHGGGGMVEPPPPFLSLSRDIHAQTSAVQRPSAATEHPSR